MSFESFDKLTLEMGLLESKIQAMREKFSGHGRTIIGDVFKQFLRENPDIDVIRWTQYTPYFNDGDECTFRVNKFRLKFSKEFRSQHMRKGFDADCVDNDDWYGDEVYVSKTSVYGQAILAKWNDFAKEIINRELFKAVFGDHVEITASKYGFDINSYAHH